MSLSPVYILFYSRQTSFLFTHVQSLKYISVKRNHQISVV